MRVPISLQSKCILWYTSPRRLEIVRMCVSSGKGGADMKIGETPRVSTAGEIRRAVVKPDAATTSRVAAPRPIDDTMSVMSIPEPELTPKVREALMTLMEEVGKLHTDLDRTRWRQVHLERLADQDTLTPIANRRSFVRELSRVMSCTERYEEPSSLIYFDVDSFKDINDNFSPAAGDAALLAVAGILVQNIRESDTVARLGSDEDGIILAHTDHDGGIEKAESLASATRPCLSNGRVRPSLSKSPTACTRLARAAIRAGRWRRPIERCTSADRI